MAMAAVAQKMQRLPPPFLDEMKHQNADYFPKVVSFGPHFHGRPELASVESFKSTALHLFAGGLKRIESYHDEVREIIGVIRGCYEDDAIAEYSKDGDLDLVGMMVHDAALVIILMEISVEKPLDPSTVNDKLLMIKKDLGSLTMAILTRDLFLLRNQIPLRVIKLMISSRYGLGKDTELIDRFLNRILLREDRQTKISAVNEVSRGEPLHLLGALHRLVVSGCHRLTPDPTNNPDRNHVSIKIEKHFHSFRTATDLKAKGIHFKPSPTQSLKDVYFKSYFFYATIRLPWSAVSTYTKVLLKNMVAYELSPDSPTELEVTSYINLMKSLIDQPEDVKVLRERRILCNMLSSDEEAVNVYNEINTYGVDNSKLFGGVRKQINGHCCTRINTWMAELLHSRGVSGYFRSPWTITAFIAAAALLAISAAQLYYAVYPPPT